MKECFLFLQNNSKSVILHTDVSLITSRYLKSCKLWSGTPYLPCFHLKHVDSDQMISIWYHVSPRSSNIFYNGFWSFITYSQTVFLPNIQKMIIYKHFRGDLHSFNDLFSHYGPAYVFLYAMWRNLCEGMTKGFHIMTTSYLVTSYNNFW